MPNKYKIGVFFIILILVTAFPFYTLRYSIGVQTKALEYFIIGFGDKGYFNIPSYLDKE